MTTLYNLHTDGDQYRCTKFIDGNPEGSYLLSHSECQCPAGHRPSCRHRQMLPLMLSANLLNSPWFWDFDRQRPTDFNGLPVRVETKPAIEPTLTGLQEEMILMGFHQPELCKPVPTTPKLFGPEGIMNNTYHGVGIAPTKPAASWRRI